RCRSRASCARRWTACARSPSTARRSRSPPSLASRRAPVGETAGMNAPSSREHDIVLFGATGFTGGLTAEYLAAHAPADVRWALAGRNRSKLESLRDRLGTDVPLLIADIGDEDSLRAVAESAKVVATTVGPYLNYGEPLVAACTKAGTDYADITGEPE